MIWFWRQLTCCGCVADNSWLWWSQWSGGQQCQWWWHGAHVRVSWCIVLMQCHNCALFWCHSADEVSQCPCQGVSVWPWSAAAQCIVTPVRGRPPPPSCTPAAPSSRGGELSREWSSATISLSITTTPRRPRPLTVTIMSTRIPSRTCPGLRIDTFSRCECGEQSGGNTWRPGSSWGGCHTKGIKNHSVWPWMCLHNILIHTAHKLLSIFPTLATLSLSIFGNNIFHCLYIYICINKDVLLLNDWFIGQFCTRLLDPG